MSKTSSLNIIEDIMGNGEFSLDQHWEELERYSQMQEENNKNRIKLNWSYL